MEPTNSIGAIPATGAGGPPRSLAAPSGRYGEKVIKTLLALCAAISVVTTTAIVISLVAPTIAFFGEVALGDFLFGTKWAPTA